MKNSVFHVVASPQVWNIICGETWRRDAENRISISTEQLRIITLRLALKLACAFFPLRRGSVRGLAPRSGAPVAFCATTRATTTTTATAARRRRGRRASSAAAAVRGLYGYLNTFAINSRERALEARSRRAMRRSFSLFAFSFCARLSSCLLARSVCTYSSGVSRLSAGSRLVSAARVPRRGWRGGFQPAFEKREQQTASRKERGGCRRSRWRARSRRNKAAINKSHGGN